MSEREKNNGRKEKEKAKRDSKKVRQLDGQTDRLHVSEKIYLVEINWNNLPGVRTQVRSFKSSAPLILHHILLSHVIPPLPLQLAFIHRL